MSRKKFVDANIVLDRIKEAKGYGTDAELAKALYSNPSTIATWRKNRSMKLDRIAEFAADINMNWLIYGDLPKWRDQIKIDGTVAMDYEPDKKNMVERIKSLDLPAKGKLELLNVYIEVLEQLKTDS